MNPTDRPKTNHPDRARAGRGRPAAGTEIIDVDYEHVDDRGEVIERWTAAAIPEEDRTQGDASARRLAVFGRRAGSPAGGRFATRLALVLVALILSGAGTQLVFKTRPVSAPATPAIEGAAGPSPRGVGLPAAPSESHTVSSGTATKPDMSRHVRDYPNMIVSLSGGGTGR